MRRLLGFSLVFFILWALAGCTANTAVVGANNLRANTGKWLGRNAEGSVMLEFSIVSAGDSGASIVLVTYAYPCGDQSVSVSTFNLADMETAHPIKKTEIRDGMFEIRVDQTDPLSAQVFTPFAFTGRIIDATHIDGTWEVIKHRIFSSESVCPAAQGTWQGRPQ